MSPILVRSFPAFLGRGGETFQSNGHGLEDAFQRRCIEPNQYRDDAELEFPSCLCTREDAAAIGKGTSCSGILLATRGLLKGSKG